MKHIVNFILILLLFTACSSKNEKHIPQPTQLTDKYRLIWNSDPKTTMTIGWNQLRGDAYVLYGEENNLSQKISPQKKVIYRSMDNRFARLENLKANSRYDFKICVVAKCSEKMYFKTAPDDNESFTFISGGDSRSTPRGRIRGNLLVSKIRPLFIAHGGDYTNQGNSKEWKRWLDEWQQTKSPDGRMYPLIVTHGNHENADFEMLHKLFDVPNKDVYYKVTFPLLSLYTLNTEIEPFIGYSAMTSNDHSKWNAQKIWLEKELKKDNKQWKVVSYHRPLRPHRASKKEGRLRYSDWSPLFYKYGVNLAIESDSHLVKYTQPLKPDLLGDEGFSVDKKNGTTYIGEGSWGAPTRVNDDDKSWTIDSGKFWQFKLITVDVDNLDIRTVKFGDENTNYNPHEVKGLTQAEQDINPKVIPTNLDLWDSKVGRVLKLEK